MPIITEHIQQHVKQLLSELDQRIEDPERRELLRAILVRTGKLAETTKFEEEKIRQNRNLSDAGRQVMFKDLSTKQAAELKFLQDALGKINTSYQFMSDGLFTTEGQRQLDRAMGREPEPLEPDAVVRHLREREIRDTVRPKPQHERDACI